jgi:biopolymer transport protein ExbD
MRHLSLLVAIVLIVLLLLPSSFGEQPQVRVLVDSVKGSVTYRVDGNESKIDELLDAFNEAARKHGVDAEVVLIFGQKVSFETYNTVKGVAGKTGFRKIQSFVADSYWRTMVEVSVVRDNLPLPEWASQKTGVKPTESHQKKR